jgi:hypothetical protein
LLSTTVLDTHFGAVHISAFDCGRVQDNISSMSRASCAVLALALALISALAFGAPGAMAQADPPATPPVATDPDATMPTPPSPPRPADPPLGFTLPSPVQVQIVPSPKTEAELDAEQRDHNERMALNDQLLIYAGLLVAIGGALALAFVVQALYLAAGLRAMRRLSESADRSATAVQRAFVYLGRLNWRIDGANLRITPSWANSGTTPTKSMRISTNWKASAGELAADFAYVYGRAPEPLFLGPHGEAEIGTMVVPMHDVEAAIDERVFLYVWGRAAYEDIFEGTKPHVFEFCHRVVVTGSRGNVAVAFVQHGLRNGTDQDRPIHEPLSD